MIHAMRPFGRQPARHDVLGRMRLHYGLRAAATGVSRAPRHQNLELRRDHVEALGDILSDPGHLATAAGAKGAGRLDHAFDPRQVRWQIPAVARRLARFISARPGKCCLGLLLCGLQHALGQFGVLERQIELVGRQLLGTLAEAFALRGAQYALQPAVRLLYLRERGLDLRQAGLQMSVLAAESVGIHAKSESRRCRSGQ